MLSGPGSALERISAYLRRERDVLKGCPIGRLTQDPDVMDTPVLVAPVEETFTWLRERLADLVAEGITSGEAACRNRSGGDGGRDRCATLQGGYALAGAADDPEMFQLAVEGVLALLAVHSVAKDV